MVSGSGKATRTVGEEHPQYFLHSYGAQFVEVAWQPKIAKIRLNRVVTVIDASRVAFNPPHRA